MEFNSFYVIGIPIRTTNEGGQMGNDILGLWQKFLGENLLEKIPNKLESSIYSVYTEYEGDYMKPYTVVLGCKVANLDDVPEGMVGITVPAGRFSQFTAKGNINEGVVFTAWQEIWNSDLARKYTTDFEVYGEKAKNPEDAEVDIFIAVK